jgi:hypothetical protein
MASCQFGRAKSTGATACPTVGHKNVLTGGRPPISYKSPQKKSPTEISFIARGGKSDRRMVPFMRAARRTRTQGMFWGLLHPTHESSGAGRGCIRLPNGRSQSAPPHKSSGRLIRSRQKPPEKIPDEKNEFHRDCQPRGVVVRSSWLKINWENRCECFFRWPGFANLLPQHSNGLGFLSRWF